MLFIVYVQMQDKIVIITVVGVTLIFYYLFFKWSDTHSFIKVLYHTLLVGVNEIIGRFCIFVWMDVEVEDYSSLS